MNSAWLNSIRSTTWPIALIFMLSLLAYSATAVEILEEIIEQRHALDPDGTLSIHDTDGSIQIYGSDDSEISIQAIKKAYTQDRLKSIVVDVRATPKSIAIETIIPPKKRALSLSDRSGTVEYIVTVPRTIRITKLDLANGEILVEGLRGSASAHLVNGLMTAHNCFGDLDLTIVNGRLEVVYDWWDDGKFSVKASSRNASIRAILPSDSSAAIAARAPTGCIVSDFDAKNAGPVEPAHALNFSIGTERGAVFQMTAAKGNIRIDKMY
jgi:hypothetical protein